MVEMTRPEQWAYESLKADNIPFRVVTGEEMELLINKVHARFPGVWFVYYMNCTYIPDSEMQCAVQFKDDAKERQIFGSLPDRSGPIYAVEEPDGTSEVPSCLFAFTDLKDASAFTLNHSVHSSLFDADAEFLIVKNSHSQIIGNGVAAKWLRGISKAQEER
jgi:hypothetical protein